METRKDDTDRVGVDDGVMNGGGGGCCGDGGGWNMLGFRVSMATPNAQEGPEQTGDGGGYGERDYLVLLDDA